MKSLFKIKIHPLYYFFLIIIILTAHIKSFIDFSLILLIHELGHILTALIFKWSIDRIVILPYGMITFFKDNLTKPIYQELLILIMGPLFQIIFNYYINSPYSTFILFINLLPIYPLDGSKIFFLFCNKVMPYYYSYISTFLLSFVVIFILIFNVKNILLLIMVFYLLYHLLISLYSLSNLIVAFCYERFKYKFKSSKIKILSHLNIKNMYRDKYHYFKVDNNFIKEEEILRKMFDK